MSKLGVVTIGRNEGERLRRCLTACVQLLPAGTPVVYVDSGSTDQSVAMARSLGVQVVELDMSRPFTMARGRNEGYLLLRQLHPDLELVQFIDGDCEMVEGWIEQAVRTFENHPRAAVVSGRRRERHVEQSRYNQLADMEWDTPIGEVSYCHGDAMMRIEAFEEAGRFDASLIAGEEPELCVRLRLAGWSIHRIDCEMTLHDAAMTRFGQWWKRTVRGGFAYAQGVAMHGKAPMRHNVKQLRSVLMWGVLWPIVILALAWPTYGVSLLLAGVYPVQVWKIKRYRQQNHGDSTQSAWLYAFFCVLGKFPQAIGAMRYYALRLLGKQARIIEYKGHDSQNAAENGTREASCLE